MKIFFIVLFNWVWSDEITSQQTIHNRPMNLILIFKQLKNIVEQKDQEKIELLYKKYENNQKQIDALKEHNFEGNDDINIFFKNLLKSQIHIEKETQGIILEYIEKYTKNYIKDGHKYQNQLSSKEKHDILKIIKQYYKNDINIIINNYDIKQKPFKNSLKKDMDNLLILNDILNKILQEFNSNWINKIINKVKDSFKNNKSN